MIASLRLCGLLLGIACCAAVSTTASGQEPSALAQADQDFKRALEIWGDGKSVEAEALLNRALTVRQQELGPDDPKVAQVIERLGALSFNRKNYAQAEGQFRNALDIDVRALGERSIAAAYLMGDLGAALREEGRWTDAQALVERSLALRRELLPPYDQAIAGSLNNLGRIYLAEHRYADAGQVLQESLRIYTATLPQDHPRVRETQALLKIAANAAPSPGQFVKVFDILDAGYRDWTFPAFGLIFIAVGAVIAFFPKLIKITGIPYLDSGSRLRGFFRYSFVGFAILWTAIVFSTTYSQYLRHKALAQDDKCRVVEGPVEHFVAMPAAGHAEESFSVAGVPFRYSDFVITGGFNNTSSHGGPIASDSYVRICYDPSGNIILRLYIRDFKGEVKDYAKVRNIFPTQDDLQKAFKRSPADRMPWYGDLFIVFYILDLVGIYALFVPYLRTFIRLRTVPVQDCLVPKTLAAGTKVKLRNSMIYWDLEDRTIWLRPRGFNFVKIPLMVAALNVDATGKSIAEYEIRFSSGSILVMAVFLWTAYVFFSATIPAGTGSPPPTPIVEIFAVMILIAGFINLRILGSRMQRLVEDALSELGGNAKP